MTTIRLGRLPAHGLCWLGVPPGSGLRAARTSDGGALETQYLPSPFDAQAGRLLARVPEGTREVALAPAPPTEAPKGGAFLVDASDWSLSLDGHKVLLTDAVENYQAPGMPNQELAYDALVNRAGKYALFGAQATLSCVSDGPLARVERVLTRPMREDDEALGEALAAYDFVFCKDLPLVQIFAYFASATPERVTMFRFADLRVSAPGFGAWFGGRVDMGGELNPDDFPARSFDHYGGFTRGEWSLALAGTHAELSAAEGGLLALRADPDKLNRDLWEYGFDNPFSVCLVCGAEPEKSWPNLAPRLYRAPSDETGAWIEAGDLRVCVSTDGHGARLTALEDAKRASLLRGAGGALFTAMARERATGRQVRLEAGSGWERVTLLPGEGRLALLFEEPEAVPGVTVLLNARADAAKNRVSWEMDVISASDEWTLLQADYPRLACDADEDGSAFLPSGSGETYEDIARVGMHEFLSYANAFATMQYMAVWSPEAGRGLYFGVHDPSPTKKDLIFDKNACTGRATMLALVPFAGIGEAKNSQRLPGQAVWQLFDGDWYDATRIYRDWALENAEWVPPAEPGEGRADAVAWLQQTACWFNVSVGAYDGSNVQKGWDKDLLEAARDLDVPVSAHVYNWHQIPFDNDYPHYFPAKDEFASKAPALQAAGIRLMPYINSRLWDMRDKGCEDYQFTALAKKWATKNVLGNVIAEHYESVESDGTPVYLGVMCPTSAVWQETQREICRRLFDELSVDGVYLDQIAAQPQPLCFDRAHAHRPGGGDWWARGYGQFMEHLRRARPKEGAYTTECNAEIYMRDIDGYLTWHWARASQVPAFSAVYSDRVALFGRSYDDDPVKFKVLTSQSLLFGDQPGWLSPRAYLDSPYRAFFRTCARLRAKYGEFVRAGEMLRPPRVRCDLPELTTLKTFAGTRALHTPPVSAARWRRSRDGREVLYVTNIAEEPALARVEAPSGRVSLSGDLTGEALVESGTLTLALPPLSAVACERS